MSDESQDENSELAPETLEITKAADLMYTVNGDINNFIATFRGQSSADLFKALDKMREKLEKKKYELYTATQRRGANSKDAKSIVQDAGLYRDNVFALRKLISEDYDAPLIPSCRDDAETLEDAVRRFKQKDDDAKRKEVARLAAIAAQIEQAEALAREKIAEEEQVAQKKAEEEQIVAVVKFAGIVIAIFFSLYILTAFPVVAVVVIVLGIAGYFWYEDHKR